MVRIDDRRRMAEYVAARLRDGSCTIREARESNLVVSSPSGEYYVALHSSPTPAADLTRLEYKNLEARMRTVHVFFRDGKTFWRRLAGRASIKADDRSLKRYSREQINAMIVLQAMEKHLVERGLSTLSYYQPESERLEESVRNYRMESVWLDYSHVDRTHGSYGFAKDHNAKLWKIAKEVEAVTGPLALSPCRYDSMFGVLGGKKDSEE